MTALDEAALDEAATTLGVWLYACNLTDAARYTVARAVIDAYHGAAEPEWLLDVLVPGIPAPQGSARAVNHRHTGRAVLIKDNDAQQKAWRRTVTTLAGHQWRGEPLDGPVAVRIDFVMYRPKATPKRAPTPPAIHKPDGDKIERAVWDALTDAKVWADDAQVINWGGTKRIAEIGETPGARIRVGRAATVAPERPQQQGEHRPNQGAAQATINAASPAARPRVDVPAKPLETISEPKTEGTTR